MKLVQINILLRQWMRGGVSTAVSLISLSLGLICSTILLLFALEEFRAADSLTPDPAGKYLMMQESGIQKGRFDNNIYKGRPAKLANRFPQISDYAVFKECSGVWMGETINHSDKNHRPTMAVTPSFTKYYKIPTIDGSLDSVLAAPNRIALTREYAAQLFPDKNPMGELLTAVFTDNEDSITRTFTVSAIVDNAKRSALKFRAIYLLQPQELTDGMQYSNHYAVMTLTRGADPQKLCAQAAQDTTMNFGTGMVIRLEPINEVYFSKNDVMDNTQGSILQSRSKESLYIGVAIAFAILVIAVFNYINITLTRSASRLKNLAGQRIMGATKWGVRGQIVADTAINVALALILALVFLPLSMEGFNSFMNSTISMRDMLTPANLMCMLTLLFVLIIIPSVSLVIKFSIRNPLETFKNPEGRKLKAAQPLVITQIVISVVLLTFGLTVSRQMTHVANSMPQAYTTLEIRDPEWNDLPQDFVDALKNSASTTKIVLGHLTPATTMSKNPNVDFTFQSSITAPEIFDLLGVRMIEGRTFDRKESSEYTNAVVNQSMVRAMRIKGSPIGEIFNSTYRIVGVCPDLRLEDTKTNVLPTLYYYASWVEKEPYLMYLRFTGSAEDKIAEINALHKKTSDSKMLPLHVMTVADSFLVRNPEITRMKTMIDVFTTISFLLTAFGLFGLSWYMVERRRREIAIRKTYGATVAGMVVMLCRSFLWQSLIAIAIALPAAYFISGYWLEGFVFRVNNAWWVLAVSASLTVIVIFVTVIGQTIRAALTNPVKYIKTE